MNDKKFIVFYDEEERFLGALPADSMVGDLGVCGLRGVHSMETLDIEELDLRLSSQIMDDQAEEELLTYQDEESQRRLAREIDALDEKRKGLFGKMDNCLFELFLAADELKESLKKETKK